MEAFAAPVLLIPLAIWVGAIVFQSAIVAPAVFAALDAENARLFLRTLFPRFFRLGIVCGSIMIAGVIALGLVARWSDKLLTIAALSAIMLILQTVSLKLVPHINAARDAGEAGSARFHTLHRLSVGFTVVVLLMGTIALVIVGASAVTGLVT